MAQLSHMDVRALIQEPSTEVRGLLASKIASDYRANHFSEAEEALAIDIFRILLKDTEARIRAAIAEQLAYCPNIPHDIILKLAKDANEVSVPVLKHSSVLTEEDLVAIVHSTREVMKLCAIAGRETISEELSGSLIEKMDPMVLQNLFENRGAAISQAQMLMSWDVISSYPSLLETLVQRGGLPITIAEKIYNTATDDVRHQLSKQYKLNTPSMHKAADDAREWAVLGLTSSHTDIDLWDDEQVEDFVDGLHFNNRLTHSLLMRALCTGNIGIFECGIAKMADVPRVNARILLLEASGRGLKAIYKAASMPEGFFEAVKVLLRLSLEETGFGRRQCTDFRKQVIDRIYKEKYNITVENMEYLLAIIGGKALAATNVH